MRLTKGIISQSSGSLENVTTYMTDVEVAGGSFDLSSINAGYTELYVKTAHTDLYNGLVADEVWDKLFLFDIRMGKTFAGKGVLLKGNVFGVTHNNFTSAAWKAAGVNASLQGQPTPQAYLTYNASLGDMGCTADSICIGFHGITYSGVACFEGTSEDIEQRAFLSHNSRWCNDAFLCGVTNRLDGAVTTQNAFVTVSRLNALANGGTLRMNKAQLDVDPLAHIGILPTRSSYSCYAGWNVTLYDRFGDTRVACYFIAPGLTPAEIDAIETRWRTFYTALTAF